MIIRFDKKDIHIDVVCGALEKHTPSKKIKAIYSRVEKLKAKVTKFMEEEFRPEVQAIQALVDGENKKFIKQVEEEKQE